MKPDYEETVLRYKDMVYRIAFAQCPCQQDAEDVFQDVFLKLYKWDGDFSSDKHVKFWLIRVTLNCCRQLRRSVWFRKRTALNENVEGGKILKEDETAWTVIATVKALPEKYRTVVEMYYYEEMSCAEIAAVLKRNEATVRTQLKRAREKLKKELEVLDNV